MCIKLLNNYWEIDAVMHLRTYQEFVILFGTMRGVPVIVSWHNYQNGFESTYPPRYVVCATDEISCDNDVYWLYEAGIEYCGG